MTERNKMSTFGRQSIVSFYMSAAASLFILLTLTSCSFLFVPSEEQTDLLQAKVLDVIDGDTIKVRTTDGTVNVRLLLVDTPETNRKVPQPYGKEATRFAEEKLNRKIVTLELDGPQYDRYDRMLAYVWIEDQLFNHLLLQEGLARLAYVYDPPYKHYEIMEEAEQKARKSQKGIWSLPGYVSERGFEEEAIE